MPMIHGPQRAQAQRCRPPPELVKELRRLSERGTIRVLIATDGGSEGKTNLERCAGWGPAVGDKTFGGPLLGAARTAKAAEMTAARIAIAAAGMAKCTIALAIDNQAVLGGVIRRLGGKRIRSRQTPGAWEEVRSWLEKQPGTTAFLGTIPWQAGTVEATLSHRVCGSCYSEAEGGSG